MSQNSSLYDEEIQSKNCITGDTDHLYDELKEAISKAKKIDIIVAFLMESGVKMLVRDFVDATQRGAILRILCGNYLNITQPQALYLLRDVLGDEVDLRFYNVPNKSFHPKAYIFEYENNSDIFIGSSNISRSALTDGIEWNYRISSETNPEDYAHFYHVFEYLFLNKSTIVDDNEMRRYSKSWRRPKLFQDLEKLEDSTAEIENPAAAEVAAALSNGAMPIEDDEQYKVIEYPCPIGPQIEALYELKKSRNESWDKGIVVAATGVGKTFLAAFDSREFNKVLFVAHREEILFQAETTFRCVRPEASTGFFSGDRKDRNCDILFATVQTLGREEYLNGGNFERDEFDYVVIDEFHHAVADGYMKILEYFKPKFLLGLTATPERLDCEDVFALCDYNIVYEVRLKEAINKVWLVPFRYYGIFDETDYSLVDYRNGKYDEKQLEKVLSINKRADLILENYMKYNSKRALGFCTTRGHALYMAEYFSTNGIKACAVISGNNNVDSNNPYENTKSKYAVNRKEAIRDLKSSKIKVIFSVDMFNEGLDIPEVDMVMFLRPTQSPTVFLQQLGRGLRKNGSKKYVNVLDFIGNYKKVNLIPFLLAGDAKDLIKRSKNVAMPDEEDYPDGCFVNYDFRLIDLFKKMADEQKDIFDKVKDEFDRIKEYIGIKPLRLSMYTHLDEALYSVIIKNKELDIFKNYLSFLEKVDELSEEEKALIGTKAHEFLKCIEKTSMTKTYKMSLLLAFYNNGEMKLSVNEDDIYESFKEFYSHGSNAVDMLKDNSTRNYKDWGKKEYVDLARRNPIKAFMNTANEFFYEKEGKFCISEDLEQYLNNVAFVQHYKDIVDYRTRRFYKERREKQFEKDESRRPMNI